MHELGDRALTSGAVAAREPRGVPHPQLGVAVLGSRVDGGAHGGLQLWPALLPVAALVRLAERCDDLSAALALDRLQNDPVLVLDTFLSSGLDFTP